VRVLLDGHQAKGTFVLCCVESMSLMAFERVSNSRICYPADIFISDWPLYLISWHTRRQRELYLQRNVDAGSQIRNCWEITFCQIFTEFWIFTNLSCVQHADTPNVFDTLLAINQLCPIFSFFAIGKRNFLIHLSAIEQENKGFTARKICLQLWKITRD